VAPSAYQGFQIVVGSLMFGRYSEQAVDRLERHGCAIRHRPDVADEHKLIAELREADVWIVGLQAVTERVLGEADRLRIVAVHGVGFDNVDVAAATRRGIAVTNTPGSNAGAVAELTIGLIIALARDLVRADQIVRAGKWDWLMLGEEVGGKTIGVVGFGVIGRRVASLARGLGMTVLVYSRSAPPVDASDVSLVPLDELLQRSDYVTIHTALRADTRGLIGERELGLMKRTACIVNTARGAIIVEEALYRALAQERIRGAALDGFATEPPGAGRLVSLPQVISAPHIGGNTAEAYRRTSEAVSESVLSVLRGERPAHLVNPEVWPAHRQRWGG
jgi:D-3-phosphoglycerate dehydrogenase / 2-oxoglutarate reductase